MTHLTVAGFAPASFKAGPEFINVSSDVLTAVCYFDDATLSRKEAAIQHNDVVNFLSNATAFLPTRYGQLAGNTEDILSRMNDSADQITALLLQYGLAVEVSLFFETSKMPEPNNGKTYLAERSAWVRSMRDMKEAISLAANNAHPAVVGAHLSNVDLDHSGLKLDLAITKTSYDETTLIAIKGVFSVHCKIERMAGPFAPYSFAALNFKREELAA